MRKPSCIRPRPIPVILKSENGESSVYSDLDSEERKSINGCRSKGVQAPPLKRSQSMKLLGSQASLKKQQISKRQIIFKSAEAGCAPCKKNWQLEVSSDSQGSSRPVEEDGGVQERDIDRVMILEPPQQDFENAI